MRSTYEQFYIKFNQLSKKKKTYVSYQKLYENHIGKLALLGTLDKVDEFSMQSLIQLEQGVWLEKQKAKLVIIFFQMKCFQFLHPKIVQYTICNSQTSKKFRSNLCEKAN